MLPLIKKGSAVVGKELLKSSANIINDFVDTETPFRDSFKARSRETADRLKRHAFEAMSGSGVPRKRRRAQSKTKTGRVKKSSKITPQKKKAANSKKVKQSKIPSNARFAYL